ncbi:hypothetical protein EX190_02870 [Lactococcus petauri]|nr:hypothetical protein EX190_02870 [Lactococcus petauri]
MSLNKIKKYLNIKNARALTSVFLMWSRFPKIRESADHTESGYLLENSDNIDRTNTSRNN